MKIRFTCPTSQLTEKDVSWTLNNHPVELSFIEKQLDIVLAAAKEHRELKAFRDQLLLDNAALKSELANALLEIKSLKEQGK